MKTATQFLKQYGEDSLLQLAFLIWGVMAVYFYQERLYSDSGFYLAKVVHYESLWVELGRYVLVLSQWLPLLCVKLGCSMKVVLVAYSLGHVLFHYGIYLFCRYRWNKGYVGWWLIAIQCLGLLHGFCTPMFELYYNTGFIALWAVLLTPKKINLKTGVLVAILSLFITVNYVLCLIFMGAVIVLHVTKNGLRAWPLFIATGIGMAIGFLLKQTLLTNSYEAAKMDWFWYQFQNKNFSWEGYIRPLLEFYILYYKEFLILVGLTSCYYLRQRAYTTTIAYLLLLLATQYVVSLTYPEIKHSRYQEQCFFSLIMIGCFPLLMDILPQLKGTFKYGTQLLLLLVISYRFLEIGVSIEPFKLRVAYMHRMIEKGRAQSVYKMIMEEESLNSNVNGPSFTFGMESLLLSALAPEKRAVQLIRDTEWVHGNNSKTLQDSTLYLATYRSYYERPDSFYQHSSANPKYMNFPPSSYQRARGRYTPFPTVAEIKQNLTFEPTLEDVYTQQTTINVPIKINNIGTEAWSSETVQIAYHWWAQDTVVHWEGERSVLEVDLLPQSSHQQYMVIHLPQNAGEYVLQVDLIGGQTIGWCHYPAWYPIRVEE
ncbi:MAG: hypothetical protein AB8E82_10085 [Aureispira sp.]